MVIRGFVNQGFLCDTAIGIADIILFVVVKIIHLCFFHWNLQDLSKLNRDPSRILYISGHALESSLQPENCVPIKPWTLENDDTALLDLIPFLECKLLYNCMIPCWEDVFFCHVALLLP